MVCLRLANKPQKLFCCCTVVPGLLLRVSGLCISFST